MKKILIITRSLSVANGQGRYSVELIKKLSSKFKIVVFTSERPRNNEHDLDSLGIDIHDLPPIEQLTKVFIHLYYTLKILPYFLKSNFVHFFSDYPYCTFFSFLPKSFKKRFITAHGTYAVKPLDFSRSRWLIARSFNVAQQVFCVSSYTKQEILKRKKFDNLVVINNGVDLNKFQCTNRVSGDKKIILGVGNLKNRKGFHVVIKALGKIKEQLGDFAYYIVGSDIDHQYFDELKGTISELGLINRVHFLTDINDKELLNLYCKSDLFILTPILLTYKFEGFGLVYLEASACGVPVIGSRDCGAVDAIAENKTGLLVDQNNPDQTADAIMKIFSDVDLAQSYGRAGITWAQEFSWNKITDKYLEFYK